jgi:hypothetical protein
MKICVEGLNAGQKNDYCQTYLEMVVGNMNEQTDGKFICDLSEERKALSEEAKKNIEEARKEIKAGKISTLEDVRRELGL